MSRTEYNEELNYSDKKHDVFHSYCAYCYDLHVKDKVGLLSLQNDAWFCSGACQSMYSHDNKLVNYPPEVVIVLEKMRKEFYNPRKLTERRFKVQYL